jgi:hypothetical protein
VPRAERFRDDDRKVRSPAGYPTPIVARRVHDRRRAGLQGAGIDALQRVGLSAAAWADVRLAARRRRLGVALRRASAGTPRRSGGQCSGRGNHVDGASRISSRRQRAAPTASRGPADTGDGEQGSRATVRETSSLRPPNQPLNPKKRRGPPQGHRNHGAAS